MVTVYLESVAVCGPGLPDWDHAASVLAGRVAYENAPMAIPTVDLLPPAERRRMSPTIKPVLALMQKAVKDAGRAADELATVFTSSGGDGETIHAILKVLATAGREVSPTKFHNSVHNAPSGYWALASACREPSTTLCAHDWCFAAGLLEAAVLASVDQRAVVMIAYDLPYPGALHGVRPIAAPFGVALVLAPSSNKKAIARLDLSVEAGHGPETIMNDTALESLRAGNPAARALPLLQQLALNTAGSVVLETSSRGRLVVSVTPS